MKEMKIWCKKAHERDDILRELKKKNCFWNSGKQIGNKLGIYRPPIGILVDEEGRIKQTKNKLVFDYDKKEEISFIDFVDKIIIRNGDIVKVTNNGKTYSTYANWTGLGEYVEKYVYGKCPQNNDNYKVLRICGHDGYRNRTLALIQDKQTEQVFIIGIDGICKVF